MAESEWVVAQIKESLDLLSKNRKGIEATTFDG